MVIDLSDPLLATLHERGLLRSGHFYMSDGYHSDTYLDKQALYSDISSIMAVGTRMAGLFQDSFRAHTIVSPAIGGIVLGYEVTRSYNAMYAGERAPLRFAMAQKIEHGQYKILARLDECMRGKEVIIVDDTLTEGTTIRSISQAIRAVGGRVVGAIVAFNRSDVRAESLGLPALLSVFDMLTPSWKPSECPHCAEQIPLTGHPTTLRRKSIVR